MYRSGVLTHIGDAGAQDAQANAGARSAIAPMAAPGRRRSRRRRGPRGTGAWKLGSAAYFASGKSLPTWNGR